MTVAEFHQRMDQRMARSNEHMARGNEHMARGNEHMARGNELIAESRELMAENRDHMAASRVLMAEIRDLIVDNRQFTRELLRRNEIVLRDFSRELAATRAETRGNTQVLADLHESHLAQRDGFFALIDELRRHGLGGPSAN